MDLMGYKGYVGMRITCRGMRDRGDMRDMRDCGDMRDMRGYEGYAGLRGYEGYAGRTTSPKSGRGVCRFFGPPPPIHKGRKKGTANNQPTKKGMLIFHLTC